MIVISFSTLFTNVEFSSLAELDLIYVISLEFAVVFFGSNVIEAEVISFQVFAGFIDNVCLCLFVWRKED